MSQPSSPEEEAVCPGVFGMEYELKDPGWALEVKLALLGCYSCLCCHPSLVLLEAFRAVVNRQGWEGLCLGAPW